MANITKIVLTRAEGPTKLCGTRQVNSIESANECLRHWSDTAPQEGWGYNKCDVVIFWDNGEESKFRYDLVHWAREVASLEPYLAHLGHA